MLHEFPSTDIAAVTNCEKLGVLEQHKFVISQYWKSRSLKWLAGLSSFLEVPGETVFSSEASPVLFHSHLSAPASFFTLKCPCDQTGLIQ